MRFSINTLGCKVNLCESDEISNRLIMLGFQRVDYRNGDPHICIINTCTVTAESDRKVRQLTRRMRNTNKEAKIIVTGCFVKQNRKFLEDNKVDLMLDNDKKKDIQDLMESIIKETGKEPIINKYRETDRFKKSETSCIRYAQKHSRPLIKIQDGCEQNCTYCIIPKVRGKYRSTESVEVVKKIKELEKNGFEEAVLTGIHIGKYGVDLENNYGLDRLIGDILSNTGIKRLRISSIEINEIDDRLLSVISKDRERIAPHFHIPLQSGSDTVLRKMARPYTAAYFTKMVSRIRKVLPDITITTDVMVGFPGESDEDFSSTFEMVRKIGFSKLHVFKYSPRPGTRAFEFKDGVEGALKSKRSSVLRGYGERSRDLFINKNIGKKHIVAAEMIDPASSIISGTSGNYIKIYFRAGLGFEKIRGRLIESIAVKNYRDGLFARHI